MSKKYFVIRKDICPTCAGIGLVENQLWEQFWAEHPTVIPALVPQDEVTKWFEQRIGNDHIPSEKEICPDCWGDCTENIHVELNKDLIQAILAA